MTIDAYPEANMHSSRATALRPAAEPRYAIYYAPAPDSAWWRFGTGLLGRDEISGTCTACHAAPAGIDAGQWRGMTLDARRYGFHATLKAPFRLDRHAGLPTLIDRISALAASLRAARLGQLEPVAFPGFVALAPTTIAPGLEELAARCVTELDDLRAAPRASDIARRRPDQLDARGLELLRAYGYPHVLERFRFHMTLAHCAQAEQSLRLIAALSPLTATLNRTEPPHLDRLCLFEETAPGAPFRRVRDWVLAR